MKKLSLYMLLFVTAYGFSQTTGVDPNNNILGALATYGPDGSNVGASSMVFNPPKNIKGSIHLFDTWRNTSVFEVNGSEKKLLLKNINYNIDRDVFESQIGKDSIFTFNFENIKNITINSREFQNIYAPSFSANKTFEVIYQDDSFALLKRYYLTVTEGSDNPMVNRPSKFVQKSEYFVKKGNSVRPFKMKKKDIMALARKKSKDLDAFAKENGLSYKKDNDVKRMLTAVLKN